MPLKVAIIGRPNVGKSTLFNRLAGKKLAIVHDKPGVTRDRKETQARLNDLPLVIIDTAGYEYSNEDNLEARMWEQTKKAIDEADVCLFLYDARAGLQPYDEHFADILRRSHKPVVLLANKCEGRQQEDSRFEAYKLGLGKSTLVNALLQDERMLTGPEAGVTRDAIASDWEWRGRKFKLVDTAGLRKQSKVSDSLEKMSAASSRYAVNMAQVVVLVLDADAVLDKQDLTIASRVLDEGRALIIAVNKWDIADKKEAIERLKYRLRTSLTQVEGIPTVTISALKGEGLDKLMSAVVKIYTRWNSRVPTAPLNKWFADVTGNYPPPLGKNKRRIKLRYITQAKIRPPSFFIFSSNPEGLPDSYLRYLTNSLRDTFDFGGVPIRITVRKTGNPYADND